MISLPARTCVCNNLFPRRSGQCAVTFALQPLCPSGYDTPMTEPKTRILVVDDDLRLRDLLQRYLTEQGFGVHTVSDAAGMDKLLGRERVDLLVLDLMLPGEDGLSICRRLRGGKNTVPIIMLTAKGEDVDRIVGLEMGADDYLPKPFNPRELLARIQALVRRQRMLGAHTGPLPDDGRIAFGGFTLHLGERRLSQRLHSQSS